MTPERLRQIEELYHRAREREPNERAAFLAQACSGDEDLRQELDQLLAPDSSSDSILDSPAADLLANSSVAQLATGTQIGPYRIEAALGAGGMGEVYRAVDTRLDRKVAIKISSNQFSERFEREARAISALNHPHICTLYDVGPNYLVMELVEGETLAAKLKKGKLSIDETLRYGGQIAAALAEAHSKGITHRDLKPGNVMIGKNGVKVLDFGLAKSAADETLTVSNAVMGTPAYMAPEQLEGKTCDARTDIYALGLVLLEMATSKRGVSGQVTAMEGVPEKLVHVIEHCLAKDPEDRWQSARDVKAEMVWIARAGNEVLQPARAAKGRFIWPWVSAVATLVTAVAAVGLWLATPPAPPEIRVEVNTPPTADPFSFALSPDGRRLAFVASNKSKSQLWVRSLDSVVAQPLPGADGASYPFWSPDSASVGFFADSKLQRIDIVGGTSQILAGTNIGLGGTWNREGTIVFGSSSRPLYRVSASGGESVPVTRLGPDENRHQSPQFLPDGRHFIYLAQGRPTSGLYIGSLDGSPPKRLVNAEAAGLVTPSGFVLLLRQGTLLAQSFDFKKQELFGNPFPVAEEVTSNSFLVGGFSATSGIVAYRTGAAGGMRQLIWFDRSGNAVGALGNPDSGYMFNVELSPDGQRVAVTRRVNGNSDVWLLGTTNGVPSRFTSDAAQETNPIWSPDGSRVVFNSNRKGVYNLYQKLASGAGADELLLESDQTKGPRDWSPDGRFILFDINDPKTGADLWVLPMFGDKKPFPFVKTAFEESEGQFSPDARWIAYQSNESGRFEIYVRPFPGPGAQFQISSNGGAQPRWRRDGREIFYVSLDSKIMAAPVKLSSDAHSLDIGTPVVLFPTPIAFGPTPGVLKQQYAVSPDGQQFLINVTTDENATSPINLIYNWQPKAGK